jgi:thiol-disulfide isomerase/thioredoxin
MDNIANEDKVKKIKLLDKYVIYIFIFIFLIIVPILLYYFKNNIFKISDYIYLKNRDNYIVENVDANFLNNYYGNENTMLVFSASWCKYCVKEQDALNSFIENNPDSKVIIISHDKTYEDLINYLNDNSFNWFVIFDKDKTIRNNIDPGSSGIPSTYLLDKNGKIIGYSKGPKTEEEFLQFYNNEIDIY